MKRKAYETPNVTRSVILMEDGVMAGSLDKKSSINSNMNVSVESYEYDRGFTDSNEDFHSIGF